MSNVLKNLKANLEGDPVAIMSKARVIETIAEIESLTNQLFRERHNVSCLQEDIRLERETRQIDEGQIVELLAERNACIQEVAEAGKRQGQAEAERDALRAELAKERERADAHYRALENVTTKNERLRAERDAALARADEALSANTQLYEAAREATQRSLDAEAERDAVRALLVEARDNLDDGMGAPDELNKLAARIDAALNKGDGDE